MSNTIDLRVHLKQADFEGDNFLHAAREACNAVAGGSTTFHGVFVDQVNGCEHNVVWIVVHASAPLIPSASRYRDTTPPQRLAEDGAIAIILALLCARDGLRVREVQRIGTHVDYLLEDMSAARAGVIEIKGRQVKKTSSFANGARIQAGNSGLSPRRIGLVAFVGPELRLELLG